MKYHKENAMTDITHTASPARSIVFVDSRVPDLQAILAATRPGVKVVILDPHENGVVQMARALEGEHGLASISVVSHGDEGVLLLGDGPLFNGNLEQYQTQLKAVGAALGADGDLLLYGCDVGAGEAGAQFLQGLAQWTGADVAASNDSTAGAARGGDWDLEVTSGQIEAPAALDFQALERYDFSLHTASVSTVAQLKSAIVTGATDGVADTITLTANIRFASASDAITINVTDGQTMTIVGGGFTLSGDNYARVLDVQGGSVAIDNLTITNGKLSGNGGAAGAGGPAGAGGDSLGAGIRNAGTLTISNSTITANKASGGGGGGANTQGLFAGGGGGGGGFGAGNGGSGGAGSPGGAYATGSGPSGITGGKGGGGAPGTAGKGGSATGGAGSTYSGYGYTTGGNGATANNETISIGGGGGGSGVKGTGGAGGNAAGGIYNASTGTLTITNSSITNNIAAGGGGGGGGSTYFSDTGNGGAGGVGIGAIWNHGGTVKLDSATNSSISTGNVGAGGMGGTATGGFNTNGANGTAVSTISTTAGGTTITNYVPDVTPPTVLGVSASTANGTYKVGDSITVQISFSENVTVTGTPQLTLATGATDRVVNYVSGSGSSTLLFVYTVQAGDASLDLDYLSTTALALNGGTIKDVAGNNATLTLAAPGAAGSLGANKNIVVDGVAPAINSASVPANATYAAGQNLDFTVTYHETVTVNTGGGTPYVALTLDTGGAVQAAYLSGSGTNTLTFRYTVAAGNQDANGIVAASAITLNGGTVRDAAGNNAATTGVSFASTTGVLVDGVAPAVSSVDRVEGATTNATSVQYTVTFSESVTGVDVGDFSVASFGSASGSVSTVTGSGTTYTVTVGSVAGDGTLRLDLNATGTGITDGAGNAIAGGYTSGQSYTLDHTAPSAPSAPDLNFSSDTGASATDNITSITSPTVTGTAEAGATVTLYDTDGMTVLGTATTDGSGNWSITSSPLASGTHTLSAKATDAAGNVSSASAGLTVTVDANPPIKPAAPVLATASDMGQSNSDGITNLTSLTLQGAAGSVEANATVHARSSLDGGLTNTVANADGSWSLNVTGLAQGTHQLQINATDAAGNTSTYSDASTVVIDTTAPTLAITSNVSAIKTGETATITFDFSEDPGSTFTWDGNSGDVVVTGGTLSAISGTGATRTATFTPDANTNGGTASITVTAASYTDMAGNAGGAGTTPALSFDTLGPSTTASSFAFSADNGASAIDLVTNQAAQTISGTLSAALVVGESVEVSLDNGSTWAVAAATVGSSTWSLAGQTLAGSDTLQARVKDAAGNTGASTSKAYVLDVTAPTFNPTTGSAPADDASAVPVSGSLVLSFSEALASLDSTKVYLKDVNTDTLVAATISLNGSGKLVIQPTAALQNSTAYYVTWDSNALKDLAGNAVVAVANETTYNFTTEAAAPPPPPPPPGDSDGVDAAEEDSVPGIPRSDGGTVIAGDGNGDGIKDSTQAEVTSLNFRQTDSVSSNPGAPKTPVTLVADSKDGQIDPDTGTAQITSISQKDAPADLPAGFSAPLGLLSFTAKIDTAGGTENFSFYVDGSLDINGYYKQDASGTWINLASPENGGKVVVENGKTRLDFVIQDGGKFDADGKADGIITDPGAPGKLVQVTPECPYDPFRNDADKDQVPDAIELAAGTNVNVKDNNVFANNSQWVNQLWRDLYGREGYGDSQATQLAQSISQGSVNKTQALAQVLSSQELDNHAGAVLRLFHTVLDRSPKMCGYNYWLGQANEGTSVLEIGRAFLNSPEFVQQYAGLDNSAFVDFLYKNALHRMPDAAGKAGWLQQLESGAMDRAEVLY